MKDGHNTTDAFGSTVDFAEFQTPKRKESGESLHFENDEEHRLEEALDRAGIDVTSLNALRRLRQFVSVTIRQGYLSSICTDVM